VGLWWVGLRWRRGQHHGRDKYATLMGIGAAESKNGAEGEQTSLEPGVLLVSQSDSGAGENGGRKEVDHKATSRAADSNGDIDALRLWFWGGTGSAPCARRRTGGDTRIQDAADAREMERAPKGLRGRNKNKISFLETSGEDNSLIQEERVEGSGARP
jgi:hypothetical protein